VATTVPGTGVITPSARRPGCAGTVAPSAGLAAHAVTTAMVLVPVDVPAVVAAAVVLVVPPGIPTGAFAAVAVVPAVVTTAVSTVAILAAAVAAAVVLAAAISAGAAAATAIIAVELGAVVVAAGLPAPAVAWATVTGSSAAGPGRAAAGRVVAAPAVPGVRRWISLRRGSAGGRIPPAPALVGPAAAAGTPGPAAERRGATRVRRDVGAASLGLRPQGPWRTGPAGPMGLGGRRRLRSTVTVLADVHVGELRRQVRLDGSLRAPQLCQRKRAERYTHTVALGAQYRPPVGIKDDGGCRSRRRVGKALAQKAPRDVRPRPQNEAQRRGPPSVPLGEGHRPEAGERPRSEGRGPEQAAVPLVRGDYGAYHRTHRREPRGAKEGVPFAVARRCA